MHWATKYIGLPYEAGARGPQRVDCWGLLRLAYKENFQLDLPLYPGVSLNEPVHASSVIKKALAEEWLPVEEPFDGALVAMSQREAIHHIGLYVTVETGRVVHCWNSQCVVADSLRGLRLRGMRTIKFYKHSQWPLLPTS